MASLQLDSLRFAGFLVSASRELRRTDRRVPRFVTAQRSVTESCVFSDEFQDPGNWDHFRLERSLKDQIPKKLRKAALQALSNLVADNAQYARPNVCMSRDAVRAVLAASRVPRDAVQILEAGMLPQDADEVVARETGVVLAQHELDRSHGIVTALLKQSAMSGAGTLLGLEPWYLERQLRCSWRERHDGRAVRARAFSRLNAHGLLADLIDFQLFVPGLIPRRVANRDARWVPLVLVEHSVESIIGDVRPRALRGTR